MIRLNKFLAAAGIASRRRCDDFIGEGRVSVNGEVVRKMGIRIDESNDKVEFDGRPVNMIQKFCYVMVNKPVGYVSTVRDPFKRKSVLDMIPLDERLFPVGRLDFDSSGLLLVTNDGELTNILIHPRHKIKKTYHVLLNRIIKPVSVYHFQNGIILDGKKTAACQLREIRIIDNQSLVEVTIAEGRNRQIRRMFEQLGYMVISLHRLGFGPLQLTGLKSGEWRYLSMNEVSKLTALKKRAENQPST